MDLWMEGISLHSTRLHPLMGPLPKKPIMAKTDIRAKMPQIAEIAEMAKKSNNGQIGTGESGQ